MTTAETLLAKIATKLEEAGYTRRVNAGTTADYVEFFKPERTQTHYYGTYLNPFSCLSYNEAPGKVYLWADAVGKEEPAIILGTVHKHNAADENTSVDIYVNYRHFTSPVPHDLTDHDRSNPIFMREIAKWPAAHCHVFVDGTGTTAFNIRIRKDASDKKIANAIQKATEAFDAFVPVAHNDDLNPADFPADTTEAHFKWVEAWKAAHK